MVEHYPDFRSERNGIIYLVLFYHEKPPPLHSFTKAKDTFYQAFAYQVKAGFI
jgi:hypothetical protein